MHEISPADDSQDTAKSPSRVVRMSSRKVITRTTSTIYAAFSAGPSPPGIILDISKRIAKPVPCKHYFRSTVFVQAFRGFFGRGCYN